MFITLFTVSDLNYFSKFENFAKSYILNETNKKNVKYNHYFIYKNKNDLELINKKLSKTFKKFINFIFINYTDEKKDKINSFKNFCGHFRFTAMKLLSNSNDSDIIIYSDVDAYINKSLYERHNIFKENAYFFLRANKTDIFLINKTNLDIKNKNKIPKIGATWILSGVIVIKNNVLGKKIINYINNTYNNIKNKDWQSDQITLDHVFWSKKFKIGILTQDYFDLNLKKENILLLCKGTEFPEERPEWKSLIKNIQNKYYEKYKKIKIVVYQDRNLKEFTIQNSLKIIYESLKKNTNHEIIYVEFKNFKLIKCDFAIMWNVYCKFKQDTDYRKKIKNFQKINNNKLIIVELGFIDRKKYYSFGLDHISNFGNYPKFPNNDIRLKKFSYELKELNYNKNPEKHILFCSQVPWDTQVQDLDYSKWIINTLKEIKKYSKRKIIFRKHPKHSKRPGFEYFDKFFLNKNKIDIEISENNLDEDLKNCYCVVSYNSTVLVDSILAGIPILSGSKSSIIYDLSTKKISDIENLERFTIKEIKAVLSNISYKQWTLEEFDKGKPFEYFF